jgi:hypothetical protein
MQWRAIPRNIKSDLKRRGARFSRSSAALGGTRIVICPGRGDDYNRVHVVAATLAGLGPLVLYFLPTIAPATNSLAPPSSPSWRK